MHSFINFIGRFFSVNKQNTKSTSSVNKKATGTSQSNKYIYNLIHTHQYHQQQPHHKNRPGAASSLASSSSSTISSSSSSTLKQITSTTTDNKIKEEKNLFGTDSEVTLNDELKDRHSHYEDNGGGGNHHHLQIFHSKDFQQRLDSYYSSSHYEWDINTSPYDSCDSGSIFSMDSTTSSQTTLVLTLDQVEFLTM